MILFKLDEILQIIKEVDQELCETNSSKMSSDKSVMWSRITLRRLQQKVIKRAKEKYKN